MSLAINPRSSDLNYVVVNGVTSPGRATLTGVKIPYKWDELPGYGLSGAKTIFRGRGLARFTLTIALWEPNHFLQWGLFLQVLEPPSKFKPLVVNMSHPLLSAADIKAVCVTEFGQPERQSNGLWLATIQLLEYRPFKLALVTPRGAIPAPDAVKPIPPKTEADIALEKARAEFAAARTAAQ